MTTLRERIMDLVFFHLKDKLPSDVVKYVIGPYVSGLDHLFSFKIEKLGVYQFYNGEFLRNVLPEDNTSFQDQTPEFCNIVYRQWKEVCRAQPLNPNHLNSGYSYKIGRPIFILPNEKGGLGKEYDRGIDREVSFDYIKPFYNISIDKKKDIIRFKVDVLRSDRTLLYEKTFRSNVYRFITTADVEQASMLPLIENATFHIQLVIQRRGEADQYGRKAVVNETIIDSIYI